MDKVVSLDSQKLGSKTEITKLAKTLAELWKNDLIDQLKKNDKLVIDLSELGKATIFRLHLINKKMCFTPIIHNLYCEHTEMERLECKNEYNIACPFQTPEDTLKYLTSIGENINELVPVKPATISIVQMSFSKIENDLDKIEGDLDKFNIEYSNGFGVKLLSFTFLANELKYTIEGCQIGSEIPSEAHSLLESWIRKVKENLEQEKWVAEHMAPSLQGNDYEIDAIIKEVIPKFIDDEHSNTLKVLLTTGKSNKIIDTKGTYKDFSNALYPYWDKECIPHKHYKSWYDFIQHNFTKSGKDISKSTISSAINGKKWT